MSEKFPEEPRTGWCASCGYPIPGSLPEEDNTSVAWICQECQQLKEHSRTQPVVTLTDLLSDGRYPEIHVHINDDCELEISYRLVPPGKLLMVGYFVIAGLLALGCIAYWTADEVARMMTGFIFVIDSIFTGGVAVFLIAGRVHFKITREEFRIQWGRGPLRIRRVRALDDILDCRMIEGIRGTSTSMFQGVKKWTIPMSGVISRYEVIPLVTVHGQEFSQRMVRIIRTFWKERLGRAFPEPRPYPGSRLKDTV